MLQSNRRRVLTTLLVTAASAVWAACRRVGGLADVPVPTLADAAQIQAEASRQPTATRDIPSPGDTQAAVETTSTPDEAAAPATSEPDERAWPSVARAENGILITAPLTRFYETRYRTARPRPEIDRDAWQLTVDGWVSTSLTLQFDDILALPQVEEMRTLECISNPVGGTLIGNATWRGVRLADVLEQAGVRTGARELKMTAEDGYQTSIPIELARHPDSLLVYEMDGEPLPVKHGYPLRVLLPGVYGQKQPKWITHLEVITDEFLGYWETLGWSNAAVVMANSQVWEPANLSVIPPGEVTIQGIAYADDSGVSKVEVSVGGENWYEAELVPGPSPLVWTEWRYTTSLTAQPDPVKIAVRATTGTGDTQRDGGEQGNILGNTFPDGTSNIHWIVATVKE